MIFGAILRRWKVDEKLRFLTIGAVNTLAGYGCFFLLYLLFGAKLHYITVALLSHFLAVSIAYFLQRTIVFRSAAPIVREFFRYNISFCAVLIGGLLGLWALVSVFGLNPLLAQLIVTFLAVLVSYLMHRQFTFGHNLRRRE